MLCITRFNVSKFKINTKPKLLFVAPLTNIPRIFTNYKLFLMNIKQTIQYRSAVHLIHTITSLVSLREERSEWN